MKQNIYRIIAIIIGQFIGAVSFQLVLLPNTLAATGLGGIALTIYKMLGINTQLSLVVLAIPIVLWAFLKYDKKQVLFATFSYVMFTFYIGIVDKIFDPFVTDPIIAAIVGGVLLGFSGGLILRQGISNGPEAIVGIYLNQTRGITVGNFFMVLNTVIIFMSILYGDLTLIMYSIIANFIASYVTDWVIVGTKRYYIVNVVTDNIFDVTDFIRKELNRGVTFVQCMDADNVKKKMMIKTVLNSHELVKMKNYIKEQNDDSFVYATESAGLLGKGFM
jgi:uncharacterized membrane-anchored protein YitT (DUF2179 family)